jgi:hypothetical protein
VDESLFEQKPRDVVTPRVSVAGGAPGGGASGGAAEAPAKSGSRFSYADVMEQPRHEPAPTLHTDFFVDAARTPRGGAGPGASPRFSSSSSFNKAPAKGASAAAAAAASSDIAQKKFGNAKSISSDAFSSRSAEDAADASARLARFQGAGAISSADYYGSGRRDSFGSDRGMGGGGMGGGGIGGGGGMGGRGGDDDDDGLDISAAELVAKMKLQAQQDMQQLKGMAASAGRILGGLAASVMAELQER